MRPVNKDSILRLLLKLIWAQFERRIGVLHFGSGNSKAKSNRPDCL